ncbi:hypothetical protein MTO96_046030 [Rhipicephalus appendiculatus]
MILGTQLRLLVNFREPVDEGSSPDLLDTKFVQLSLTNAHSAPVSLPPRRWGSPAERAVGAVRGPPFLFEGSTGAEMEVVSVEGEDIGPHEFGKESGWCEVRRGAKTQVGGEPGSAGYKRRGGTLGRGDTKKQVEE